MPVPYNLLMSYLNLQYRFLILLNEKKKYKLINSEYSQDYMWYGEL